MRELTPAEMKLVCGGYRVPGLDMTGDGYGGHSDGIPRLVQNKMHNSGWSGGWEVAGLPGDMTKGALTGALTGGVYSAVTGGSVVQGLLGGATAGAVGGMIKNISNSNNKKPGG